ncbi:hypothetical protein JOQ06_014576, partial [Pogonophryne albipinna]
PSATGANVLLVLLSVFTNRANKQGSMVRIVWEVGGGTRHSEHLCSPCHRSTASIKPQHDNPSVSSSESLHLNVSYMDLKRSDNHRRHARAAATGLSAEAAKVPREGGCLPTQTGPRSPPCGPPAAHVGPRCFLRARCSWSTLNKANSGKRSITVRSKTDGLSEPSPVRDPAPGAGKWLKKAGAFQAPRLLLGVILRCQVAANVLAANGGE